MWYFSGKVQMTGWWMQAWLNTSSSVFTNKIPVTPGLHPSGAGQRAGPRASQWPCCSTHLIPRFTASPLSDGSLLCGNTTHLANHCPPLVHHHGDIPFIIPSIHWPAPTPMSHGFHELAARGNEHGLPREMPAFRDENNRAHSLAACRPLRQQWDARSHKNKSLLLGYFYRKFRWEQGSSGNTCRHWERLCKKRLFLLS